MTLAPGTRLGPYEITAQIGVGGMGEVYKATDTTLKRAVAIKVLPESVAGDADRLARFRREAEVLASLNHPNIAQIHGVEKSEPSTHTGHAATFALVMELVEGPTLADRIAQGAIPLDEALPIATQIAEALETAHERGIIHRDLKPANIKVRPDGTVKVLDFGLAKAIESPATLAPNVSQLPTVTSPALLSQAGVILGTAAYMSPEQARGKSVDRRTDVWAFGCVLYEMLTGGRAFGPSTGAGSSRADSKDEADDVAMTLSRVLQREPDLDRLPPDVPAHVRQTLHLCLRKPVKERVPDMGAVRLALAGAFRTTGSPVAAPAATVAPRWRRALGLSGALVAGGLLTAVIAWSVWPVTETRVVTRFSERLPPGEFFRNNGRPVIALSRDGQYVIYNKSSGLYLRPMDALEGRLLPGTNGLQANLFFAPDGESVGYFEDGQLKRIGLSGGTAVVICSAAVPFGASWEPDDTILFGQARGIMRVSAKGGVPELVIPAKEGEQFYGPQLLPGGDSVLFSLTTASGADRWDAAQVVVQSLSTGQRTTLIQGGSDARYVSTGHLVYALGTALLAVPFDVGRLEVRGGPVSLVDGVARAGNPAAQTAAANFAVSDNGTLIYLRGRFTTGGQALPQGTLVWVDRNGREEQLAAPPRRYVYPRLSPDGTRVALDIRDQEQDIWIWDLRRNAMTRFTFASELDAFPAWTPDGRWLVWGSAMNGSLNLFRQAADGTGSAERLTESPNAQRPSGFTPDGQRLLLGEGSVGQILQDLGMLSLEGDRRVNWLVKTASSELNGEISPDGRWLAYQSNESGEFQIYVRPFPNVDQGRWQVSTNGGTEPLWARSGREIFYLAPDGTLMGAPVETPRNGASFVAGPPAALVDGGGYFTGIANQLGRSYDASADGSRFLRIKVAQGAAAPEDAPPEIVVVQHWTDELRRRVPTN